MTKNKPIKLSSLDVHRIVDLRNTQSVLNALIRKIHNATAVGTEEGVRLERAVLLVREFGNYLQGEELSDKKIITDSLEALKVVIEETQKLYSEEPTKTSEGSSSV